MSQSIGSVTVVVRDYDEAIDFFVNKLGFTLLSNRDMGNGKRWVLVAPPGSKETSLLLAQAVGEEQARSIGNQAGGRCFLFLNTDDFQRDYEAMKAKGVKFLEEPRHEVYATVVVFEDVCGNKWDLIQRK